MLKKPGDAISPSEENPVQHEDFISPASLKPLVKGTANMLMHFVHRQDSAPHKEDIEVMESVIGQSNTETSAPDADTVAEHDKSKSIEGANLFKSVLNTALQEYGSQQQRLLQYIEQTDKLRNDVDRLASTLEETEQQRQSLIVQNNQTTAELNSKIEELFEAIQITNEQREQLEAAAHQEDALYSTIRDYDLRCQSLEERAHEADELDRKIADLNTELQLHSRKFNEIQTKALAFGNDNEILKLSLEDAEQDRQELEARNKQTTAEFARKVDTLAETLRATEEQHQQLVARHSQSTADFTRKIEELTGTLQAAEEERQQIEAKNSQSAAEFTARVAELTTALHTAEQQRQQLELRHNQSTTEFTARVDELTAALQATEQRRAQLEAEKYQVTAELNHKVAPGSTNSPAPCRARKRNASSSRPRSTRSRLS
jgi:chromosome segregation ATPase